MLIYFLRHGDASVDPRYEDSERPLTKLGKEQASRIGKHLLNSQIRFNTILTSPLARARETGSIVQSLLHTSDVQSTDFLLNGSDPKRLLKYIDECDVESMLLVGHEPFLSELISLLIRGDTQANIEIKKCSLALLEIQDPQKIGTGVLKQLLGVETLSTILDH